MIGFRVNQTPFFGFTTIPFGISCIGFSVLLHGKSSKLKIISDKPNFNSSSAKRFPANQHFIRYFS